MSQYIITDGQRFIHYNHAGRYIPTFNESLAEIFTKKQADGVYNNSLPKALRKVFRIEKYKQNQKIITENSQHVVTTINVQRWADRINGLNGLINDATKRKDELINELSSVDKEISDVLHYIEFSNLNAAQGYQASKLIKDCRIRRRAVKNELTILGIILENKIGEDILDKITKTIIGLNNARYEPRVLDELFDVE